MLKNVTIEVVLVVDKQGKVLHKNCFIDDCVAAQVAVDNYADIYDYNTTGYRIYWLKF